MVVNWVEQGESSPHLPKIGSVQIPAKTDEAKRADPAFAMGVHFKRQGNDDKAKLYWAQAQALNPDSWNYHRQDWSYTPEQAGKNWQKKVSTLGDKPYYRPIEGLDGAPDEDSAPAGED